MNRVSDKFTIDDLREVSNIVQSNVLPTKMIEWPCKSRRFNNLNSRNRPELCTLLEHAVHENDLQLLKFILEVGAEQQRLAAEEDDDQTCYTVSQSAFYGAIGNGRTAMLAEMIKATGVGLPLNDLIEKSGIETNSEPRCYQGLSVGGKKKADWAQAPGDDHPVVEERIPPLLHAAHLASIDSVEWFMSDAPFRRYKEFAEGNRHDKRIKTLAGSGKGYEKTIGHWLNGKSELLFPDVKNMLTEIQASLSCIVPS